MSLIVATFSFISNGNTSEKYASVVMDASSSKVIRARNANQKLHPAGLTKLMTLYIAFDAIKNKEISTNKIVTVSKKSASEPPSKMGLRTRQKVKFEDLIIGVALLDANDAATAIAEGMSKTEVAFVSRMNLMAESLGMFNTTFKNAHGLTEEGHLSTALDMAILGRRLILDFPNQFKLLSERYRSTSSNDFRRKILNQNIRILDSYKEIDAVKSGYSRHAGYNFFATAQKKERRLIVVNFGNRTTQAGIQEVRKLFDIGFRSSNFSFKEGPPKLKCNKKPLGESDITREVGELRQTFKKWNYYVGDTACWIISTSMPKRPDTLSPVPSCLGGTTLAMTHHTGEKSLQISISADFLIERDIGVSLFLGEKKYPFFAEDDSAWPINRDDEPLIVNEFLDEQTGILEFYSSKTRQRNEVFSSAGFNEAFDTLNSYCPFMRFAKGKTQGLSEKLSLSLSYR